MNSFFKFILVFFTISMLSSCTTLTGQKFGELPQNPEQGKSRIVVFRAWSGTGAVWPAHFYVDGKLFAELDNGGLSYINVIPGKHKVSSGPENNPTFYSVEINTEENKEYFVRLLRGLPGSFEQLPPEETKKMLIESDFRFQSLIEKDKK